jgi:glutaminyl-peptide cyclotransferase
LRGKFPFRTLHGDLKIILILLIVLAFSGLPPPARASDPVQAPAREFLRPVLPTSQVVPLAAPDSAQTQKSPPECESAVTIYGYRIIHSYPHDPGAFTQGLIYHNGYLYEGTGLRGRSSLRKVALETGKVLKRRNLPEKYFGEGIAICGNRLIQLTYQSKIGFIYDLDLRPVGSFSYPTEGWGLTCDGSHLILSDGTATLRRLDARTFRIIKQITVTDRGKPVRHLNELEFVKGEIFANIWKTDTIARISPDTGQVTGWIDLAGLARLVQTATAGMDPAGPGKDSKILSEADIDVLNGIAYDAQGDRLFVTGKFWPKLFEIKLEK